MASDTRTDGRLTIADLCRALVENRIPHTLRDGSYQLSHRDLRRLAVAHTEHAANALDATAHDFPLDLLADPYLSAADIAEMDRLS